MIDHADIVFTNSFHGTAFSTIFNKRFYSFVDDNINQKIRLSSRIVDLLSSFGLTDRIVYMKDTPEISLNINYEACKETIEQSIEMSKNFLTDAIED